MSQSNSIMIPRRSRFCQARVFVFLVWAISLSLVFTAALRAGLLSSDAMGELKTRLLKGSDLSELKAVISGIESEVRSGGEREKMTAINQSIELAGAVLSTVDQTVPLPGTVLRTPNLESLGPQGKRIFAGSDPEAVQDPALRAEYKKLIRENDELLIRVGVEREKYDASQYALNAASRIIESSSHRTELLKSVQKQVEEMSVAPWAKEKLLIALIPTYEANPTPSPPRAAKSPQNLPGVIPERPIEPASTKISRQLLAKDQAPAVAVTNPDSGVALEPRPIWPWITFATAAAFGLAVWGMLKRRS